MKATRLRRLFQRLDAPGVLILVDPPYIDDSRPRSVGTSSAYVHDAFDHATFDDAGLTIAGDYSSHRNIPNGEGRDVKAERLYLLDRTGTFRRDTLDRVAS